MPIPAFLPAKTRVKRRRHEDVSSAAALTLASAVYGMSSSPSPTLTLVFDRAVDISAMDGSVIVVHDSPYSGENWAALGAATLLDPVTAQIFLADQGDATGEELVLDAGVTNGIVAVDNGAVWAGVTDWEL